MPSDKRARQRAAREARLEAERQAKKRRTTYRNVAIVVVIAGVVVLIAFLLSGHNNKPTSSKSTSTTTTTAPAKGKTAALQTKANDVAVKAGCPESPTTPTAAANQSTRHPP